MQIPAKHKLKRQIRRLFAETMFAIAFSVSLYFGLSLAQSFAAALQQPDPALAAIIDGPQRSDANKARDRYRRPLEVLTFFGVKADSRVVEIVPGRAGYWVEILAPYLKDRGYYTASGDPERDIAPLKARIAASPELYGKTKITEPRRRNRSRRVRRSPRQPSS
jgi:predicted methyltransferase